MAVFSAKAWNVNANGIGLDGQVLGHGLGLGLCVLDSNTGNFIAQNHIISRNRQSEQTHLYSSAPLIFTHPAFLLHVEVEPAVVE